MLVLQAGLAHADPKLRMERLGFEKLPDVRAYLTYVEPDGTPILGKTGTDFKLLLDSADAGAASQMVTFEKAKEPVYVAAVVQLTPTVESVLKDVKDGLRGLSETVNKLPGSRMSLLGYASDVKRLVENGTGGDFQSALSKLAVDAEGAEPHLLDALRIAIDLLNSQPKGSRKLVVLFSDGIDVNNEKKAFTDIGRRAQLSGVVIDTIGYTAFEGKQLRNLSELTKNSYGIERGAKASTEIGTRFGALFDEILGQYVVTFPLSIQGDGKEHGFQAVHAAGKEVYSQTFNAILERFVPPAPPPPPPSKWWKWLLIALGVLGVGGLIAYLVSRKPAPAPVPMPPGPAKLVAPMPTGGANKTLAIQTSGDVAMGWLLGLNGPFKDKKFVLKARVVIGTAPDCDIVLQDGYASSRHCEIRQADGGFKMIDLGSTNGVVVNDKKMSKEHFLVDNDAFRVGRTEFKFKSIVS